MGYKEVLAALVMLALPAASSAQTQTSNYSLAQVSPGSWTYLAVPGGSEARFVDTTATIRLTVHCAKMTRQVTIARTSSAPAAAMSVWTSSATRTLPARFEPNAMRVSAELVATDALLDSIAFSRGRVVVSMPGMVPLVVPAWPEAARAVEDCRI